MTSMERRRKTIRLNPFDYTEPRPYFITICTEGRQPILARVVSDNVMPNPAGMAVRDVWNDLPDRYPGMTLETIVVMPDHVHGIMTIPDTPERVALTRAMNAFKSLAAREVNQRLGRQGVPVWQRSFHDRVIRGEHKMERLLAYIEDNPRRWVERLRGEA